MVYALAFATAFKYLRTALRHARSTAYACVITTVMRVDRNYKSAVCSSRRNTVVRTIAAVCKLPDAVTHASRYQRDAPKREGNTITPARQQVRRNLHSPL